MQGSVKMSKFILTKTAGCEAWDLNPGGYRIAAI
jgi:hypothetical protein